MSNGSIPAKDSNCLTALFIQGAAFDKSVKYKGEGQVMGGVDQFPVHHPLDDDISDIAPLSNITGV